MSTTDNISILLLVVIGVIVLSFAYIENILSIVLKAAAIGAIVLPFAWLFWIFGVIGLAEASGGGWSGYEPVLLALFIVPFGAGTGAIVGLIVGLVKTRLAS